VTARASARWPGCPLLYGYVPYSAPGIQHRTRFTDAAALAPGGVRGSLLGGTGLAIARRSAADPAAIAHAGQGRTDASTSASERRPPGA
jgi:hypothetical protein